MGFALEKEHTIPKTLVIGLGETGNSVARFLMKQDIEFKMLDTRLSPPMLEEFQKNFPDIEVQLGDLSANSFVGAEQVIVSPGIDVNHFDFNKAVHEKNCICFGDIELFAQNCDKPVVAITGSNGKSTVTTLLAEMARQAGVCAYAGGNLAPPALDLLANEDAELFVLELSSFQLESIFSLKPIVSVVLNVSDDHLDRHGDIENYANVKARIYTNAKYSVVNRNDEYVSRMKTSNEIISFGLDQPYNGNAFGVTKKDGMTYLAFGEKDLLSTDKLALRGEAGILNSLAALALGHALKLPMKSMLKTLQVFKGLPHRLALVAESDAVKWFNDSKGTNIGATVSSLKSLGNNVILIAGGIFKGGDLDLLKQAVIDHVKQVILLGQDAPLLAQALNNSKSIEFAHSMKHAVEIAKNIAIEGDIVLLSPACASFDMYQNYEQRGNDFEHCVNGILS